MGFLLRQPQTLGRPLQGAQVTQCRKSDSIVSRSLQKMSPPASCLSPVHLRGQQRSGCAEGQDRTCIFPSSPKRSWQGLGGRSPEKSAQTLGTEATSPGRRSSLERGRPLSPAASPGGRRARAPRRRTPPCAAGAPAPPPRAVCPQHLCRCALRKRFGGKCFHLAPLSPGPKALQSYLLLEPEGVLH